MFNDTNFCDLNGFAESYKNIHGYLSLVVCVFGSVANISNICVLTTKEMRWPTNLILTGLAVADLLVMLEYIPFNFYFYISKRNFIYNFSYNWAVFTVFHALFSQVFHFTSCCLTVILAVWRYITITNPRISRVWCSMNRTLYVILFTYFICPIICLPIYFSLNIYTYNQTCTPNGEIIEKKKLPSYTGVVETGIIYYTNNKDEKSKFISFCIYGVVIKLIPCLLLTYLSRCLISVLLDTQKRRKILLNSSLPLKSVSTVKPSNFNKKPHKDKQAERTSTMLIAVLLLFLITEFPQAILGLLSAIYGETFESQCYKPLAELMDILALTNSAINFILYCTMSRQFRSTFSEVFRLKIFNNWMPLAQHSTTEKTQLSQV